MRQRKQLAAVAEAQKAIRPGEKKPYILDALDVLVVDEAALGGCAVVKAHMKETAN
jgi:hypothetical protein